MKYEGKGCVTWSQIVSHLDSSVLLVVVAWQIQT